MIAALARAALPSTCLLLAACAGSAAGGPAPTTEAALRGGWELVERSAGGTSVPLPAAGRATFVVEGDTVTGTAFCNGYGSRFRVAGGRLLLLESLAVTEVGCAPELMAAERGFLDVLGAREVTVSRDRELLVLAGDEGTLTFRALPSVPPPRPPGPAAVTTPGW